MTKRQARYLRAVWEENKPVYKRIMPNISTECQNNLWITIDPVFSYPQITSKGIDALREFETTDSF